MLRYPLSEDAELCLLMHYHAEALSALVRRDYDYLKDWLPWVKPDYSLEDARSFITRFLNKLADNDGMMLAIFYQGQLAGTINYHYWQWHSGRTELGYWLGHDFWGKGIITQAVSALTTYAFDTLCLNRVEILTDVVNLRSAAVPKRLGYAYEGIRKQWFRMDGQWVDVDVYYMLAKEWA